MSRKIVFFLLVGWLSLAVAVTKRNHRLFKTNWGVWLPATTMPTVMVSTTMPGHSRISDFWRVKNRWVEVTPCDCWTNKYQANCQRCTNQRSPFHQILLATEYLYSDLSSLFPARTYFLQDFTLVVLISAAIPTWNLSGHALTRAVLVILGLVTLFINI